MCNRYHDRASCGDDGQTDSLHDPNYDAYLLRLWREDENAPWRFSLRQVGSERWHGFATLDNLAAFLQAQIDDRSEKIPRAPP
jgi:hypothetical protein